MENSGAQKQLLNPLDRASEILFGLIMALSGESISTPGDGREWFTGTGLFASNPQYTTALFNSS